MNNLYTKQEIIRNREDWIHELRHGSLSQANGRLHVLTPEEGFCCLGVAGKTLKERLGLITQQTEYYIDESTSGMAVEYAHPDDIWLSPYDKQEHNVFDGAFLSPRIRAALGLSEANQEILAHLNDNKVSFEIIAGVIEMLPIDDIEVPDDGDDNA